MPANEPKETPAAIEASPSKRLLVWLIAVTILTAFALVGSVLATVFGTYMSAFAADDPSAGAGSVIGFMVVVWAVGGGVIALLIAGVVGGWIAYRKRRNRLSFGLSLLAAVPILLSVCGVLAFVVTSFVWTAGIQGPVPTAP